MGSFCYELNNHDILKFFFYFSTADAHIAAIATQNQNQSNQTSQPTITNNSASTPTQESLNNDPDLSMDQEDSLPEPPEIMPKGNPQIFVFILLQNFLKVFFFYNNYSIAIVA